MRCLAVGQDEIVIRMLDEILLPSFEIEFNGEDKPLPPAFTTRRPFESPGQDEVVMLNSRSMRGRGDN